MQAIKVFELDHGGENEWILASSIHEALKFYIKHVLDNEAWNELVSDVCGRNFEWLTYDEFIRNFISEVPMDRQMRWQIDEDGSSVEASMVEHVKNFLYHNVGATLPIYVGSTFN